MNTLCNSDCFHMTSSIISGFPLMHTAILQCSQVTEITDNGYYCSIYPFVNFFSFNPYDSGY